MTEIENIKLDLAELKGRLAVTPTLVQDIADIKARLNAMPTMRDLGDFKVQIILWHFATMLGLSGLVFTIARTVHP